MKLNQAFIVAKDHWRRIKTLNNMIPGNNFITTMIRFMMKQQLQEGKDNSSRTTVYISDTFYYRLVL